MIKFKTYIWWMIKLLIAAGCGLLVVQKLSDPGFVQAIGQGWRSLTLSPTKAWLLVGIILLGGLNWSIEGLKWRWLLKPVHPLSWVQSTRAVLVGIACGLPTPNRIGEYFGRGIGLPETQRWRGVTAAVLGSFSQSFVTVWMGIAGLVYWWSNGAAAWNSWSNFLLLAVAVVPPLLFTRLSKATQWIPSQWDRYRLIHHVRLIEQYPANAWNKILVASVGRYGVFCFQFLLLLQLFEAPVPWLQGAAMVALTFFVNTFIPSFALSELLNRQVLAWTFIGLIQSNEAGITNATLALWAINIATPALVGAILLLFTRTNTPLKWK